MQTHHIVSITSQGQMTIPSPIRNALKINKNQNVQVYLENDRIVVEPVKDFMELAGSLHYKRIKGKSIDEVMAIEKKAVEDAIVDRYKRKLKRMSL